MMTQPKKQTAAKPAARKAVPSKPAAKPAPKKPAAKSAVKPATRKTTRRPTKAKRAEVRRATRAAVGEMEKLAWLWKTQQDAEGSKEAAADYQARRYAVYALAGGAILLLGAVTDLIPFGQIMTL